MQQRSVIPGAPGLNYIGDLRVNSGLGQSGMALVDAALTAKIPLAYRELPLPVSNRGSLNGRYKALPEGAVYGVNLLHYNAEPLGKVAPEEVERALSGKYTAGVWFWELSRMPEQFALPLRYMDEMWAASRFVADAVLSLDPQMRVEIIPVPIDFAPPRHVNRGDFGIPEDRYVFLFTFAASSHGERKNPFGVVDAFERAFGNPGEKGPLLVIKVRDAEYFPEFHTELVAAVERVGGLLIEEDLARSQMNALLACADAYVSLHRSEGFGMGMAESMRLGKPVIGTAYSGNIDFMTNENSYLVDYRLRRITTRDHYWFGENFSEIYEPGMEWAYPDIEHAATHMKRLFDHPEEGRARGAKAADDIQRLCSSASVGKLIADRLAVIEREKLTHRTVHAMSSGKPNPANLTALETNIHTDAQRSAGDNWYRVRVAGDRVPFGRLPLVGAMLRIFKRSVLLGKLSLAQTDINLTTLRNVEALADRSALHDSVLQDIRSMAATDVRRYVDSRLAEIESRLLSGRQGAFDRALAELEARYTAKLDEAKSMVARIEEAELLNRSRMRLLEQQLEDAGIKIATQTSDSQQGLSGHDLITLVKYMEQAVPALADAPTISLSIQDGQSERELVALATYLGDRLDSRNGAITASTAWYHFDFTPGWDRRTLFSSAASRLRPDGHLVLVTEPGRQNVDAGPSLTPVFNGEAQTNDARVQVFVWRLTPAHMLERR